jgi:hypothetical protein
VSTNTRRFNSVQGILFGVLAGVAMWTLLIGTTMWAVSA